MSNSNSQDIIRQGAVFYNVANIYYSGGLLHMEHPIFTSLMTDSTGAQAVLAINEMVAQLTEICALFDYKMSRRKISLDNLATIEKDIREIIRKIDTSRDIKRLFSSAEAALGELRLARNKLNLAANIVEMPKNTTRQQEQLYRYYDEICIHVNLAIGYLNYPH